MEHDDDISGAVSVLVRTGVPFSIEEVGDELYDYLLDDGSRYVDLSLRTKEEIKKWINCEPFETRVKSFLESHTACLRLSFNDKEAFLKVVRRRQVTNY